MFENLHRRIVILIHIRSISQLIEMRYAVRRNRLLVFKSVGFVVGIKPTELRCIIHNEDEQD